MGDQEAVEGEAQVDPHLGHQAPQVLQAPQSVQQEEGPDRATQAQRGKPPHHPLNHSSDTFTAPPQSPAPPTVAESTTAAAQPPPTALGAAHQAESSPMLSSAVPSVPQSSSLAYGSTAPTPITGTTPTATITAPTPPSHRTRTRRSP